MIRNINSIYKPNFKGNCLSGVPENNSKTASIIYFNDEHSDFSNLGNLGNGIVSTRENFEKNNIHPMVLSAGDVMMYHNPVDENLVQKRLGIFVDFLNLIKLDAMALGNHEFECGEKILAELLKKANFKVVSTNTNITNASPLKPLEGNVILKSHIIEKDGVKYGIIGAIPFTESNLWQNTPNTSIGGMRAEADTTAQEYNAQYVPRMLDKTVEMINNEVASLTQQGINRIILVSHIGHTNNVDVAKRTKGIDVIIGGHTHEVLNGLKKDINIATSLSGEPVVITQAGQNGEYFGILNLLFDEKGVIDINSPLNSNEVLSTKDKPFPGTTSQKIQDSIFDTFKDFKKLGNLAEDVEPDTSRKRDNSVAIAAVDGFRKSLNATIGFIFSSVVRSGFKKGPLNEGQASLPIMLNGKVLKAEISEKDLVEFFEEIIDIANSKSTNAKGRHDIPQVSGMKCGISEYLDDKGAYKMKLEHIFVSDNNSKEIDIMQRRDAGKKYTVAFNDFYLNRYFGSIIVDRSSNIRESINQHTGKSYTITDGLIDYIRAHTSENGTINLKSTPPEPRIIVSRALNQEKQKLAFIGKKLELIA